MSDDPNRASASTAAQNATEGLSQEELDALVAAADTGGRTPSGPVGLFILLVALVWSLFQLWIASPLPFMVGFGVFNDTEARSFHLAFALFLAFAAYPAARGTFQTGLAIAVPVILSALFIYGSREGDPIWWIPLAGAAMVGMVLLGSPRNRVPVWEWALAILGAAAALYIYFYYDEIGRRVGAPIVQDFVVAVIGILILLEEIKQ